MSKRAPKDQVLQKKFEELEKKNEESILGGVYPWRWNTNFLEEKF